MLASWWKNRRRRRILAQPFPAEWTRLLERRVRHYRHLPAPRRRLVDQIVQVMVAEKEWAGAAGLVVSTDMRVTIAGHADSTGKDTPNLALSMARAEVVRSMLRARGVDPDLLGVRGAGPLEPMAEEATDSDRSRNRRVSFSVRIQE